jgi:hypothetical protein
MGVLDKVVDAASKMGSKVATAPSSEAAGIKAKSDNVRDYMNATAKEPDAPKADPVTSEKDKLHPTSKYGDNAGEQRINTSTYDNPLIKSYKKGTDYVPKTGPAILHQGEKVIPAKDNKVDNKVDKTYDLVKGMGKHEAAPKKEIAHIKTSKAHGGGYVHEHHHTRPEHHPVEHHVSKDQDAMVDHMMQHMGDQNPGEADADAGQSGVPVAPPAAGAAPAAPPMAAPGA